MYEFVVFTMSLIFQNLILENQRIQVEVSLHLQTEQTYGSVYRDAAWLSLLSTCVSSWKLKSALLTN